MPRPAPCPRCGRLVPREERDSETGYLDCPECDESFDPGLSDSERRPVVVPPRPAGVEEMEHEDGELVLSARADAAKRSAVVAGLAAPLAAAGAFILPAGLLTAGAAGLAGAFAYYAASRLLVVYRFRLGPAGFSYEAARGSSSPRHLAVPLARLTSFRTLVVHGARDRAMLDVGETGVPSHWVAPHMSEAVASYVGARLQVHLDALRARVA